MRDIIINFQISDTLEIQLTIAINFTSSKNVDEKHIIHSKSNNVELKPYEKKNEVVD